MIKELEESLTQLEKLLRLSITIVDYQHVWSFKRSVFTPLRRSHRKNAVCKYGFCDACILHCRYHVNRHCLEDPSPFVTHCWKGVCELAVPLERDRIHYGILYAGIWRIPGFQPPPKLPPLFYSAFEKLPEFSYAYKREYLPVLQLCAAGIIQKLADMQLLDSSPEPRVIQIREFLLKNISKPLQLKDLAEAVHLSQSRTAGIVKQYFKINFSALLRSMRLNNADFLLRSSDMILAEIAEMCGLRDQYYLSKIYKAERGITPGKYRKLSRTQNEKRTL